MELMELIVLGVALGTDAFSMSVALGTKELSFLIMLKLTFLIVVFHVLMPLIGINMGAILQSLFKNYYFKDTINVISNAIGAGVLIIMGMIIIYDSLNKKEDGSCKFKIHGLALVVLSLSVSIDALSVGFSLGLLGVGFFSCCILLGVIAGLMVIGGFILGEKIVGVASNKAGLVGGVVLILLGIRLLFSW